MLHLSFMHSEHLWIALSSTNKLCQHAAAIRAADTMLPTWSSKRELRYSSMRLLVVALIPSWWRSLAQSKANVAEH